MQDVQLSVIVCTYNREKYIAECLRHLADQSMDFGRFEVVVVNNKSTDNTEEIILKSIEDYPQVNFLYFVEEQQGHTFARNRGILESRGEILSFIDDDAFVCHGFCMEIDAFFERQSDAAAIGGRIIPEYEIGQPKWMSRYLLPLVAALDRGDEVNEFTGSKFPIGANMAFRKSVFDTYGLFDEDLGRRGKGLEGGDEKEVFLRLKKGKEKIYYVPKVAVTHIIPEHRVQLDYIKGLATGVGASERKRLSKSGWMEIVNKIGSETIKVIGTPLLSLKYLFSGETAKANMLLKFRIWVLMGYLKNQDDE